MPAALAAVVAVSAVLRTALAWLQQTPVYLPDEYLYSSISRSLLTSGRPLVQGGSAHFWALLAPLLEAPVWLVGSVSTAYRLAQAEQSLAISLSALPVYWLARRLDVQRGRAVAVAGLTLLLPDLVYSSTLMSESFALPLFLTAVCAAVSVLDRGGRVRWARFVALALVATTARLQFVVLVPLVLVSGFVLEARRRERGAAVRLASVLVAMGAVAAVGGVAVPGVAGRYDGIFHQDLGAGSLLRWASYNGIVLALAAGWVVVPGAAAGLVRLFARPSVRSDEAFALVTALVLGALLVEAAFFAFGGFETMERYTFYAAPLLFVAFGAAWQRGFLSGRLHLALAVALVGLGIFLPHFTDLLYTQPDGSPSLLAYRAFLHLVGWQAGLYLGLAAGIAAAGALALARRNDSRALVGIAGLAGVFMLAGAGYEFYEASAAVASRTGRPLTFLDSSVRHDYLMFSSTDRAQAQETLFWNRGIERVFHFGGVGDGFQSFVAHVDRDGRLLVGGRPVANPVVVDRTAAWVRFASPALQTTGTAEVVRADAKLRALVDGYIQSGAWLTGSGTFAAWPRAAGEPTKGALVLRVWGERTTIRLHGPGCSGAYGVHRAPGLLRIEFDAPGAWTCHFRIGGGLGTLVGDHFVTVHAQVVCFAEARGACRRPSAE